MAKKVKARRSHYTLVDRELLGFIKRLCRALAIHYGLRYNSVHLMDSNDNLYFSTWGYYIDGAIVIKIRKAGHYMPIEEIVDTIAHEMAHLLDKKDEDDHAPGWKKRYQTYKRWLYHNTNKKKGETSCHLE